jgi:hypothetical protein
MLKYLKYGTFTACLTALGVACGAADDVSGDENAGGSGGAGGRFDFDGGNGANSGSGNRSPDELRDAACTGWSAEPENLPAVLMLVVDVSGSMNSDAPGSNQSKWEVTRDALQDAINALPGSTAVGVLYYPNRNTSASTQARPVDQCVNVNAMISVDLLGPAGSAHRNSIAQSLQNADTGGGTPTHDAFRYAVENGMNAATSFPGNRFMLLITDGQPTFLLECLGTGNTSDPVNEQPIVDEIAAARAQSTRTFVIGSPGSEDNVSTGDDARPWLSRAANAGETASAGCSDNGPNFCHMDMTQASDFGAALRTGLAQIAGAIVACDYALPEPPAGETLDLGAINVIHTPGGGEATIVPRSNDANCTDGWRLDDNQHVVLCPNTCSTVQADASSGLEVLFGCASVGPPPT